MAQEIHGLDLGCSGIKLVRLRRNLTGLEWIGAHMRPFSPKLDPFADLSVESLTAALREFWSEHRIPRGHLRVSVPTHWCSIRTLKLPFSDPRKLTQVVPFEVEALLPYPLDEVVIDHQLVEASGSESTVVVFALPKAVLRPLLEGLKQAGLDPIAVEPEITALQTLVAHGKRKPDAVALLDVGACRTQLGLFAAGRLRGARALMAGAEDVTHAIQARLGLSEAEAEEAKFLAGMLENSIARFSGIGLAEAVRAGLEPLRQALVPALHISAAETGRPISQIWFAGGGARLKGFDRYLAEVTGLEVVAVPRPTVLPAAEVWDPAYSVALGLALKDSSGRPGAAGSTVNFRRADFTHAGEASKSQSRLRYLWIGAALILILAGVDLYTKFDLKQGRYQASKGALRAAYQRTFPDSKAVVDELQQAKGAISELEKKAALLGYGEMTPLQALADLTAAIPEAIRIEVQDLVIESKRVRLEAETDSFESVDRIKGALQHSARFLEIAVSDAKATPAQNKVRFRMTFGLRNAAAAPEASR